MKEEDSLIIVRLHFSLTERQKSMISMKLKKFSKLIAIMCVAVLVFSVLAGCGGDEDTALDTTTDSSYSTDTSDDTEDVDTSDTTEEDTSALTEDSSEEDTGSSYSTDSTSDSDSTDSSADDSTSSY